MERDELIRKLHSLAQLDTDAVAVYDEALEHVTDDDVRKRFEEFQGEHRYHADQLTSAIERLGAERPSFEEDFTGRMAEWVTAIRSQRGTQGALHAMETAEHYHNRHYDEAVAWDVGDAELAQMLQQFDDDEKRHLAFIEERLGKKVTSGAPQ